MPATTGTKRTIENVVVDDIRNGEFPENAEVVYFRNSTEALEELRQIKENNQTIETLWLDHDLGGADTAMPIVTWFAQLSFERDPFPVEKIYVHTANPSARKTMLSTLDRYGYKVHSNYMAM